MHDIKKQDNTTHIGYKKISQRKKAQWVRHQFDSVAQKYDLMNTLLSFGIHYLWKKKAIKMLDLEPGFKILDLCGGTGDLAVSAAKIAGKTGQVVLCDINREMMNAGRNSKGNAKYRQRINYVQADAEQMCFPDNYFDAAVVGFGIRNLTDMEAGFKEMYRVLKPGGTMVCLEFSRPVVPFFRRIYDLYSFHIMPWLGEMFTGSREAYTYLPESIRLFPLPDELKRKLEHIGFIDVRWQALTNGVAVIHRGIKQQME